jgi:hypothetical protein
MALQPEYYPLVIVGGVFALTMAFLLYLRFKYV